MITKAGQGSWVEKEEERQGRLNAEHARSAHEKNHDMFIDDSDLVFAE